MPEFLNTWRKRLACQRCRQLKVRCEFSSLTSDQCIRCQRSGSTCITQVPGRKDGSQDGAEGGEPQGHVSQEFPRSGESKEEHAVYLRRIIRDAELKLMDMGVSPLRQAIAANLYTVEEAEGFYENLRRDPNAFPALALMKLPANLMALDKEWPQLAIAIVTVQALTTTRKPLNEMKLFIQDLFKLCDIDTQDTSLDRLLGFALSCQYTMSYHERGMGFLLHFHVLAIGTIKHLQRVGELKLASIATHVAAATLLPYAMTSQLAMVNQICYWYNPLVNFKDTPSPSHSSSLPDLNTQIEYSNGDSLLTTVQCFAAGPLMEMVCVHDRAVAELDGDVTLEDVNSILENALQTLDMLSSHTLVISVRFAELHSHEPTKKHDDDQASSIPNAENLRLSPLQSTYLLTRLKVLKKAVQRIFDIRNNYDPCVYRPLMWSIIGRTAEYGGQLFRAFAHIDTAKPFARTNTFYHVSDALLIMQFMRFVAFAAGIDNDVRSDCLLEVVATKWQEMNRSSIQARQLYWLLFGPLGFSSVKIGVYSEDVAGVVGSGILENFNIIYWNNSTQTVRETVPFNRLQLENVIEELTEKRFEQSDATTCYDDASKISLSMVLYILFYKL